MEGEEPPLPTLIAITAGDHTRDIALEPIFSSATQADLLPLPTQSPRLASSQWGNYWGRDNCSLSSYNASTGQSLCSH